MQGSRFGGFLVAIVLTIIVTAVVTALVTGILFRRPDSDAPGQPMNYVGIVTRENRLAGEVLYPNPPFQRPPTLKLEHDTPGTFEIVAQDEFGFSWVAKEIRKQEKIELPRKDEKIDLQQPDFVWKEKIWHPDVSFRWTAVGRRAAPGTARGKPKPQLFEQSGTFNSVFGEQGEVNFPLPYPAAPNVELSGSSVTIVVESRPTGFKWKNTGKDAAENKLVTWKSKGLPKE